jgi:ATP-dependent helicase/nuclease subunit A
MSRSLHEAALKEAASAQARAADPASSAYATANAGSGKTKVLIDRVARLLLRRPDGRPGAAPDSILCITYTRAAASEMLSRLFRTLGDWAVMEDAPLREALARLEGTAPESYTQPQLRAARALFARALETPGGLRIETIHAFCARVLRRFPLEAGVAPGFVELEDEEAGALWERAKQRAIIDAAQTGGGALALLAREAGRDGASTALDALKEAGSKLRAFASAHDDDLAKIERGLKAVIRPPEKSADALISEAILRDLPRQALSDCIPALEQGGKPDRQLAEILRATLAATDPGPAFEAYKQAFFTASGTLRGKPLFTRGAAQNEPMVAALFSVPDPLGEETSRILAVIDAVKRAETYARTSALMMIGLPAIRTYDAEKEKRGALDFDDLIERTRSLLSSEGLSSWVLYKLDGRLSHVLLDEAQDTSPAQWDLIRALTQEFTAGEGRERLQDPRTVFMVGDEKQSIYSFQGADPAGFLAETQALTRRDPGAATADMRMSFRSSPEILSFVDTVWNEAPAIEVPFAQGRRPGSERISHTARRWNEPGCVELWPIMPKDPAPETDAWARPVDALRVTAPKVKLARAVAAAVKQMVSGGASVWASEGVRRRAEPGDILILVRERRGGFFEAVINALKSAGVPVAGADRLRLADYIGVQDCLNLMRFAMLPERDLTLAEILRGPFCGLTDDDRYLYPLSAGRRQGETLWSRVQACVDSDVARARAFLASVISRSHLPPYEFLSYILEVADQTGSTGWEKLNARLGTPARDPVEALLAEALAHDAAGPSSIQLFVAGLEANPVEIKRDLAEAAGEVRVMTVHGAKGLQAPIVILPDTTSRPRVSAEAILSVDGALVWSPRKETDIEPVQRARLDAEARSMEEHRRLLYVALTRAQDRLLIAGHWHGPEGESSAGYHPGSWYALCLNAMGVLCASKTEDGILRHGSLAEKLAGAGAGPVRAARLPEWIKTPPKAAPAERVITAPTGLPGPGARVVPPFDSVREARLRRGRLIHSLLQYLPELPPERRSAAGAAYLAREPGLTASQRNEMLQAAMGVVCDADFSELFGPGGRAEAVVIGTSARFPPRMVINGRVDRLVVTRQRVLVIDFKTDQPAPGDVSDVAESYITQMAAYAAVLETAFPGREIVALLCWTDGPKMMRIPPALLSESLKPFFREV